VRNTRVDPIPDSAATRADSREKPGALVSVAWLRKHLDDPDLRIVHVSSEPQHYPKGHIRRAVFADLHSELALRGRDPSIPGVDFEYLIPDARSVADSLQRWGVGPDDRVVFYDDVARNRQAIRGLWVLRLRGFPRDRVHVLDGGTKAWWGARLALTTDVPEPPVVERYPLGPEDPSLLASRADVEALSRETLAGGPIRILDVRTREEFAGTDLQARRGGHIPGAVNLNWEAFVNDNNTFKSLDQIEEILGPVTHGDPDALRATYCQGGIRASAAWFVLSELLSIPEVRNYSRGWEEWGNRADTAIEGPGAN
jgi:thiosulfate/3-mercaptopyruvate sulfurtransferase